VPLFRGGGAGSSCNTMWPEPRSIPVPPYQVAYAVSSGLRSTSVVCRRLATIYGPQLGGAVPAALGGGAGFPSNAVSSGLRSTSVVCTQWHLNPSRYLDITDMG